MYNCVNHIILLLLCGPICTYSIRRNNVCKTFGDYFRRDVSSDCWYNPDETATASELILQHGYPLEIYEAITEDFYILQIFRIPPKRKNNKHTIFLQHPVGGCCTLWIDKGNISLAFRLADENYDVWLGNFRGTIYSNKHVYLSPESNKYWNFSFHEYGIYDLPAQLEVVKRVTGRNIFYIGHSVATTASFAYSSLMPRHAKEHIKLFILFTPVASLRDITAPIANIAPFTNFILLLAEIFHSLNIIPHNGVIHTFIKVICNNIPIFCATQLMSGVGTDWKYADPSLYPIMFSQNFAGFSGKVFAHYAQILNARGRFQLYDYGIRKNQYYYHAKQPPLYPVENISIPMLFMYGGEDTVAVGKDIIRFYNELPSQAKYGITNITPYNHVDFVYAKEVVKFVYDPAMEVIKNWV